MQNTTIDTEIRASVEAFVSDLTQLIRSAALEAVTGALTGDGAKAPRKAGRRAKGPGRRPATAKAKSGKRVRRTAEQVEQLSSAVLAHVAANPGQRLGAIAKALKVATKDARQPAFALVKAKKLKTTGQRGGTRYFPKGAKAASPAKRATKKKAATRKAGKGRKRTTKKAVAKAPEPQAAA